MGSPAHAAKLTSPMYFAHLRCQSRGGPVVQLKALLTSRATQKADMCSTCAGCGDMRSRRDFGLDRARGSKLRDSSVA
jgi:hypothetical protein